MFPVQSKFAQTSPLQTTILTVQRCGEQCVHQRLLITVSFARYCLPPCFTIKTYYSTIKTAHPLPPFCTKIASLPKWNKMKKKLLALLLLAASLLGGAQTKPRNSIGLSLGWQNFTFLDRHVSPLTYSTNSLFPKVGLFYNKQTDRSILNIQVAAAKGSIDPSRFGERSYKAVWSPKD